jgi:nucleoside-diphosphate-sugar epimerase
LRPSAVYGPYSQHPREWWFVKRLLDGRTQIPLAYRGTSRFHTSSFENIAALVAVAARVPGTKVLNAVDPEAPTVADIGRAIMVALGGSAELVEVPDGGYPPGVGDTPWSVPRPFVLSDAAAREVGYTPAVVTYTKGVEPTCYCWPKPQRHATGAPSSQCLPPTRATCSTTRPRMRFLGRTAITTQTDIGLALHA